MSQGQKQEKGYEVIEVIHIGCDDSLCQRWKSGSNNLDVIIIEMAFEAFRNNQIT